MPYGERRRRICRCSQPTWPLEGYSIGAHCTEDPISAKKISISIIIIFAYFFILISRRESRQRWEKSKRKTQLYFYETLSLLNSLASLFGVCLQCSLYNCSLPLPLELSEKRIKMEQNSKDMVSSPSKIPAGNSSKKMVTGAWGIPLRIDAFQSSSDASLFSSSLPVLSHEKQLWPIY
uniref:Uncharacterized protein n=1 Tax=Salix viminalis TaxID=40686 RepID=A0A6N2NIV1_SALVM